MKCPYCLEEIKDGASVCRYCGRDLSFLELLRPMIRPILEKITSLESDLLRIASEQQAAKEGDQKLDQPSGRRTNSVVESLTNDAIAPERPKRRVALTVVLAASVAVISSQISYLQFLLPEVQSEILDGVVSLAFVLVNAIFVLSPIAFGFLGALAQPGRHLPRYMMLGLLVGLLTLFGNLGLGLLGGLAGLPTEYGTWYTDLIGVRWVFLLVVLVFGSALLFTLGSFLGDLIEERKY